MTSLLVEAGHVDAGCYAIDAAPNKTYSVEVRGISLTKLKSHT